MLDAAQDFASLLARGVVLLDGATGTELTRRGVPTPLPLWSAGALREQPDVVRAIHRDYVNAGAQIVVANTFRTNVRTLRNAGAFAEGGELNRIAIELAREAAANATTCHSERSEESSRAARRGQIPRCARNDESNARNDESNARNDRGDAWNDRGNAWNDQRRSLNDQGGSRNDAPLVAASVAPVEDCYHPERAPDENTLAEEHGRMMDWLKAAGPDLIWIETMGTVREARAASRAARNENLPFIVSFVVRENGDLLSGEPLEDALAAVEPYEPIAFGLNCIPPDGMTRNLPRLRAATHRPLIAYAHIGNPEPINGWSFSQDVSPEEYAEHARRWIEIGAQIVGGCCGTTPAHIAALRPLVEAAS